MTASYTIHESVRDGIAHLVVVGDIDLAAKAALEEQIARHIAMDNITALHVDIAAVAFIDSTGIGALVVCRHAADDAGKPLTISGAHGRVADMMELTGVRWWLAGEPGPRPTGG